MIGSHWNAVAFAAAALALAGCASSPPSSFYTLTATATSSSTTTVPSYGVSIGPVTVPETVDRPQLALQISANQVALAEFHRWAEPLASGIAQAVAENLRRLLGTSRIAASPGVVGGSLEYRVALSVVRFESKLGNSAELDILWTIENASGGAIRTGRSTIVQ
ncbi:MAG: PqiC family protein, partial [Burkholderiales bacterium]